MIGSGKSTYVKDAVMRARTTNPSLKIKIFGRGTSLLQLDELHNKFGIAPLRLISTFFPKGTVIVIDQVDNTPGRLNELSQEYIVHLATDNRNSKIYSIILCVSNLCISSFQYICVIFSMKKSLIRQIRNVFLTNHKSII